MATINERIKLSREGKHLSKTELAKLTGLTIAAMSQFESGVREPSLDSLRKLADALGVSTDYLMGRNESEVVDSELSVLFRGMQNMTTEDREDMVKFYEFLKAKKIK